jgi:transcriptional regulator with XRE-family HTH domain
MTLGERVLVLRHRHRMSQVQLAEAVGVNKNTIARLERGEIKDLAGAVIVRLARVFGVSADMVLGMVELDDAPPVAAAPSVPRGRRAGKVVSHV